VVYLFIKKTPPYTYKLIWKTSPPLTPTNTHKNPPPTHTYKYTWKASRHSHIQIHMKTLPPLPHTNTDENYPPPHSHIQIQIKTLPTTNTYKCKWIVAPHSLTHTCKYTCNAYPPLTHTNMIPNCQICQLFLQSV